MGLNAIFLFRKREIRVKAIAAPTLRTGLVHAL